MKICPSCGVEKDESSFRKRSDRPGGVGYHCKECACDKSKNHYQHNIETRKKYSREYRKLNVEETRERVSQWFLDHPGYANDWKNKAYATDPDFHVRSILRSRFLGALKRAGAEKNNSAIDLLGCPVWHLWAHFDFLFKPGMTRANHGSVWEVDHIKPCAKFDLTDPEQQKACFHWTNLQPLFIEENRKKRDTYNG